MLLFCYGVLLNSDFWRQYIGRGPQFLYRSVLPNHRLVFDGQSRRTGCATANVVEGGGYVVLGGLFEINESDLPALDSYEGVPDYYQRKEVKVMNVAKKLETAFVYCRTGQQVGLPHPDYLSAILKGAEECEFLNKYKRQLPGYTVIPD